MTDENNSCENVTYLVWLEIEEIDESRDHYQTMDTPGAEIATFATYEEARRFVERADALLRIQASNGALLSACKMAVQCLNHIPNTPTLAGKSYDVIRQIEQVIRQVESGAP